MLRVECAWCQTVITPGDPGAETTHGICPACYDGFVADAGLLRGIAQRVLTAYAKVNPTDFTRAMDEMRREVEAVE